MRRGSRALPLSDRLLAVAFVLFVTIALAGIVSGDTGASYTTTSQNASNTLGSNTLAAPTALSAAIASNGGTVNLAWTATTSTWATGERVYRATVSGGPYSLVSTITNLTTTTYSEAPGAGIFYYVVTAYYTGGGANWTSANSAEAVAKPLDHFAFAAIAAQHSGVAFNVSITAQAQDNSTVTGYTGTATLTISSGSITAGASATFTAGTATQSMTITGPYTTGETVTATGGSPSRTGTSAAFTLNHFRATALAVNNKSGGVAGKPENLDTIVLTFSEAANTASMGTCPTTGSGSNLVANNLNPDTLTANGASLLMGTINLGGSGYFTGNRTLSNSICQWSAGNTVLTIFIQGAGSVGTDTTARTATYTPAAAITSATGEAIDTAQKPTVTAVLF